MAWSIGLHLGEHFSEVVAQLKGEDQSSSTKPAELIKKRFFTPQMAPEAGLSQFLAENSMSKIDRIQIATSWPQRIIESRHGSSMAVLTTSGFENWLELTQPLKTRYFSPLPERPAPFYDSEFVFGANERVNAQGHIEKLLEESELEFLCTKLELNQIKNVAVCFLHSYKNNTNETLARKYLEAKGFQVYASSQTLPLGGRDPERFWQTIRNAYCRPLFVERLQKVSEILTPLVDSPEHIRLGRSPLTDALTGATPPLLDSNSVGEFLTQQFAPATTMLYCGLEEFLLLDRSRKAVAPPPTEKLKLQPLSTLGRTFLSPICFSTDILSFDPGPISFGRGLTPTFFDLLAAVKDFTAPMGSSEKFTDRGRARLNEYMVAYARSSSEKMNVPADQLVGALLQIAGDMLREDVRSKIGASHSVELHISGPLANAVTPLLRTPAFKVHMLDDEFLAAKALFLSESRPLSSVAQ